MIFGATGGVMDAALRSAYYLITGRNPNADTFRAVRGMDNGTWKEASFNIPGAGVVKVAVVSSLGRTRKLMEALRRGDVQYDFVEVMACPGGCAGGGGQPIVDGKEMAEYRGGALWIWTRVRRSASAMRMRRSGPSTGSIWRNPAASAATICSTPTTTPGRCRWPPPGCKRNINIIRFCPQRFVLRGKAWKSVVIPPLWGRRTAHARRHGPSSFSAALPTTRQEEPFMEERIALVGIIVENPDAVEQLNAILHEYSGSITIRISILPGEKPLHHQHCHVRPQ